MILSHIPCVRLLRPALILLAALVPTSNLLAGTSNNVPPGTTLILNGTSSMGTNYEILGGTTVFQDDGSGSGILLRGDGGTIKLMDSANAATAMVAVDGGPGNGGLPGHLLFYGNSTAGNAEITNLSGVLGPNFKNANPNPTAGLGGQTRFFDSALAGTAHIANAAATYGSGYDSAITSFDGNSSADHAVFLNYGVSATTSQFAYGGETYFASNATAGSGIFTNFNSNNGTPFSQGRTVFFDNSSAGNGTFVSSGGDGGFLELGGTTEFRNNSTAANGTFLTKGSIGGSFPGSGKTQFFDNALAGTAHFTNGPGVAGGAAVEFNGHSSADHATIVNQTDPAIGGYGGVVVFKDDATAGFASITHHGYQGGETDFHDRSTAGNAAIVLESHPNYNNSRVVFTDTSTAGNAVITTGSDGTLLQFYNNASAGNASITIGGNAGFNDTSTASNATITVLGSNIAGDSPGNLGFVGAASTGNAHFFVQGATVNSFGSAGGVIAFDYNGSAGSATFTINGGAVGCPGGRITFGRGGNGGQARFIINAGGTLDFGGTTYYGGATAGSIEGAGLVLLSSSSLTVGSLNTSNTFSGEIADGQLTYVGVGGQLNKVGTGSLWLTGSNSYTGLTTVSAGTLSVNGSIKGDVLVKAGATLKGSGNVGGTVTAEAGATVSPGNSPGTLTIGGNYSQNSQGMLAIEVAGPNPQNHDLLMVSNNVNLSGRVLLIFSGYAPVAGDSYTVVQAGGTLSVSNLDVVVLGLKAGFQPTYQVSNGKLTFSATSDGQLRTAADSVQTLQPLYSPQNGFTYAVFTVTGANYEFDTSTDLKTWTPISEVSGAYLLYEFRHAPPTGESARFYRVLLTNP